MTMRLCLYLLAVLLLAPSARADEPPPRTIAVNGEGRAKAAPDLAVLAFAVETTATTAGAAAADNAKKSTALADAIKKKLGAKDRVYTTQYSLVPQYEQRDRSAGNLAAPPRIVGYVAANAVRVELHNTGDVGGVIDAATAAGANRIDQLEFTLEAQESAQTEALKLAGADARRQAEAAAAALGVTLGKVLSASTGSPPVLMPKSYPRLAMAAMDVASPPTPVEAGDVTISATLQVTYEIQ
jgi:uncharacterized protein YggE